MKRIFKNSKLLGLALIAVATLSVALIGTSLAYFQDETVENVNQFILGDVTTEIVEIFYDEGDGSYHKEPRVTNTGKCDCYVRMRFEVTPEKEMMQEQRLSIEGLTGENWEKKGDWFYYKAELKPGESTTPLFTGLTVDYNETDKPWVDFDVLLFQEAVQAEVIDTAVSITEQTDIWQQYENEN